MSNQLGELVTPAGTLQCTLRALKEINTHFGNCLAADQRVASFDFSAFPVIVAAGLGKKVAEVEEQVFSIGMKDLQEPLKNYIELLANAGRPWKPEGDAPKGEA